VPHTPSEHCRELGGAEPGRCSSNVFLLGTDQVDAGVSKGASNRPCVMLRTSMMIAADG